MENEWMTTPHSMGTSIMAVSFDGGVVVGADSRTTTGTYIANRVTNKLTPVHEKIFCCRSGSAADTQAIADIVKFYLDLHGTEVGEAPEVKTAATLFQQLCYQHKNQLMAGIIIGGFDKYNGGQVFVIPLGGTLMKVPFAIGGSGSTFIYGYCDANYRPGMTKDECLQFVRTALSLAMSRDSSSGGVVRTVVINEDGISREMICGDELPFKQ